MSIDTDYNVDHEAECEFNPLNKINMETKKEEPKVVGGYETASVSIFNPTIAEINKAVTQYKTLKIDGIEDKAGYEKVGKANYALSKVKSQIEKQGKKARDEANWYAKSIIGIEKDILAPVLEAKKYLKGLQDDVDNKITMANRLASLPERREKLAEYKIEATDEQLMTMDANFFVTFLNTEKIKYFEAKEAKAKEDERLVAEEKRVGEERLATENRVKLAKEQGEAEAKEKIAKEAKNKKLEAEKEKKRLANEVGYNKFLADNGYTHENSTNFHIANNDGVVTLWKFVAQYKS